MAEVENWLQLARAGDRDAFDRICAYFQSKLIRFCQQRMSAQARAYVDVEDILQETSVKAFQLLDRVEWQGESALFSWFCRIALNIIYAHSRRFLRLGPIGSAVEQQDELQASPSREAMRKERLLRLEDSLARLTPEQREVVTLTRIRGMTVREAAAAMRRSEKATYQLLWRAMKKLRELFGDTQSLHLPPNGNLREQAPGP